MRKIENTYVNQSRWNDAYGKSNLAVIQEKPQQFIVNPARLRKIRLDLIDAMSEVDGKQILEFGAGRGEFSVALAKLGANVTGVEIGEDLVALANEVARVNNVGCDFIVGSITELDFEDGTFDFVVGNAILHHLPKQGVVESLSEAHRVLKPQGMALFTEPIENSRMFDYLQNLIPVGEPNTPQYRPSILERNRYNQHLEEADDRAMSDSELTNAKGRFREIEIRYYGLTVRLARLNPNPKFRQSLDSIDTYLTHRYSPVKKLSQQVLVLYKK